MIVGTVYLLHFASPVNGKRHYVGFTQNLVKRLHDHSGGILGCELTNTAVKNGIPVLLGKTWTGVAPEYEQKLKAEKNLKRHCSACNGAPSMIICEKTVKQEDGLVPRNAG